MNTRSNLVALVSMTLLSSSAQAATVTYLLDLTVPNTFTLTAQASLGDNGGIATYGVPLTGTVLTLDHRTPLTFTLNTFNVAGFWNLRSPDNNTSISASQPLLPNPHQIGGFGQEASNWAAKGVNPCCSSDATSDAAWLSPLVIAVGTYNSRQGTLGYNNASSNLLASVYADSTRTTRIPAIIRTWIVPLAIPEPSSLVLIVAAGMILSGRRFREH